MFTLQTPAAPTFAAVAVPDSVPNSIGETQDAFILQVGDDTLRHHAPRHPWHVTRIGKIVATDVQDVPSPEDLAESLGADVDAAAIAVFGDLPRETQRDYRRMARFYRHPARATAADAARCFAEDAPEHAFAVVKRALEAAGLCYVTVPIGIHDGFQDAIVRWVD